MTTPFNPRTGEWEIAWPGRVARHDLVYGSPPEDPMQGIPLGNGDVGALAWCEGSTIVFALNKCDLWDDAEFTRFHNWKADEEEFSTTLRHACRLVLDFRLPVFDLFYLSGFDGRLSLADASLTLSARTPFGAVSVRAFVSHAEGLLCCTVESDLKENVPLQVRLERYGSRTFSHWYSLVNRDPALGLEGTDAAVSADLACLTHRLRGGRFAAGCTVVTAGNACASYVREHFDAAQVTVSGGASKQFSILLAVTAPVADDPAAAVGAALTAARRTGVPALYDAHARAWRTFWLQSLLESGDDYLDNLWHLTMYYANASQRGAYPGRFINGLWGWSRDVQNWNFYFHWNQQQVYWPLQAAGHPELLDSYLDYRFRGLPWAQQDAQEMFHAGGAFVSDVCDRRGWNSRSESANHTPVAQIALDFWRQYRFTGDPEFLRERALPYLIEAATFFEALLARGDDGRYHASGGSGYEGWIKLSDAISELACAKVLFATVLVALAEAHVQEPRAHTWQEILAQLAPLPTVRVGADWLAREDGTLILKRGLFKGGAVASDTVFAAGFGIAEKRLLTSFVPAAEAPDGYLDPYEALRTLEANNTPYTGIREDVRCHDGIFPWVEFAPVFPAGLIGLADRATAEFQTAVNTAKLFGLAGMGWDPLPIVLARLGLAAELERVLRLWPGRWQFYCNGWGHYGPRDFMKADAALRFRTTRVRDSTLQGEAQERQRLPFPAWPFRHMGMESMSVLACALNEALLQSHDGIIRVAPACHPRQTARFTLHATGGFRVSAEVRDGRPLWVCVEAGRGGLLKLELPWSPCCVFRADRGEAVAAGTLAEFALQPGERILLTPDARTQEEWETVPLRPEANAVHKVDATGTAMLGLPRMF